MIPDGRISRVRFETAASRCALPGAFLHQRVLKQWSTSTHAAEVGHRESLPTWAAGWSRCHPDPADGTGSAAVSTGPSLEQCALRRSATTACCASPLASRGLCVMARARVFAAWTTRSWSQGPSRRSLCEPFSRGLDPSPGSSCGARARFFPQDLGRPHVRNGSALCLALSRDFTTGA
jgi:hypothetical protein